MRAKILLVVCVLMAPTLASANFVSYVDLAGMAGDTNQPNVVRFVKPGGGPIGGTTMSAAIKDYATGANTPVTLAITATDAHLDESFSVPDYAGGDAMAEFGTIVDNNGYIRYDAGTAGSKIDCVFTGLDPNKLYTIVLTGARGSSSYSARHSIFTISDVDAATNTSSSGAPYLGANYAEFNTGYNTTAGTGYVARFSDIRPGADGDMTITAGVGPHNTDGNKWYVNQLKLVEVPEPGMISLLALGLPLITRRRRQ